MANHAILRRLPSVVHGLLAIVEERDCHQARGFVSTATNIKTVYNMYLLDIIGDELTKLTKHFDADGALICEVYYYTQEVRAALVRAKENCTPKEKQYFRAVNQESLVYTDPTTLSLPEEKKLTFQMSRRNGRWPDTFAQLPRIKQTMFNCVVKELDSLFPADGVEYMFSVFDLRKINTVDEDTQEGLIEKLCDRFGVERRKFSKLLQRWIRIPAFFEPGDNREIFQEFYNIRPILIELGQRLGCEKPRSPRSVAVEYFKQVDLFEIFLREYGTLYPRVSKLIRTMLLVATNSSLIERVFSTLKAVKTPTRNRLELRQLERLLVLGTSLPDNLSKFDLDKYMQFMST